MKSVSSRPFSTALTVLLAGLSLLATACGQKGPLTLPASPAAPAAPATSSAASAASR